MLNIKHSFTIVHYTNTLKKIINKPLTVHHTCISQEIYNNEDTTRNGKNKISQ